MDIVTWINTVVGMIGIVVGIIGAKNMVDAKKIRNSIKAGDNAYIQNAQIINNGLDSFAVIKLSRETTREELEKIISEFQPMTEAEIDEMFAQKIQPAESQIAQLREDFDKQPKIYYGTEPPTEIKDGDIYLQLENGDQ